MNFCQNCGIDLRSHKNAKFCFNCGKELSSEKLFNSNISEETINDIRAVVDNFDYFDFPQNENDLRQFISHISEHIAQNSFLNEKSIAKKYFEKGNEYFYKFSSESKYIKTLEREVALAIMCYEISLNFDRTINPLWEIASCYDFKGDYIKANHNMILYSEIAKDLFGIKSEKTTSAAMDAYHYNLGKINLEPLPNWIFEIGWENNRDELPI